MEATPQSDLVGLAFTGSAMALFAGSFVLFLAGTSAPLGASLRTSLEPVLRWLRDRTSLTRSELADATVVVAVALAVVSGLVERSPLPLLVAVGLWIARPAVRRVTREERDLLAFAGHFSIDQMIGLYIPIIVAQFLLAQILLGICLLTVVVALSWPAGGGTSIPGRRWRMVTARI